MEEFLDNSIEDKDINILIKEYMPLIIKSISSTTGKYVSVENDDEFSIALIAFKEAVDKYESHKGSFSSFAKIVISSRIKNYLIKENKHNNVDSIEQLKENGIDIGELHHTPVESSNELSSEIIKLKEEIGKFGFTFEDLVEEAPKHTDTRERAIDISENVNKDVLLKSFMYEKKRLPIKQKPRQLAGLLLFILSISSGCGHSRCRAVWRCSFRESDVHVRGLDPSLLQSLQDHAPDNRYQSIPLQSSVHGLSARYGVHYRDRWSATRSLPACLYGYHHPS